MGGGFPFLGLFTFDTLQCLKQRSFTHTPLTDQYQLGFVERFGIFFQAAEICLEGRQTLFICALKGGVEGVATESKCS
jgi:hypothetical protein